MKFPKKSNKSVTYKGDQSWHNLRDANVQSSRITTFASVYRRIRPFIKWAFFFLSFIAVFFFLKDFVFQGIASEKDTVSKNSGDYMKKVLFYTDGVLDEAWLSGVIQINRNMQLMDINIFEMKHSLERFDQVLEAEVIRVFPDALRVELKEEVPIFKLKMQTSEGVDFLRCVGESGLVYEGVGYSETVINELPYLIPYRHSNQKYLPINGLGHVSPLMNLLKEEGLIERLRLQSISLENFSGDSEFPGQIIEVNSDLIPRILFSAYKDYPRQIARLNYILSYINGSGNPEVERVDLSLRDSAAVEFKEGKNNLF
jgi:hypothetical protein